MSNSYSLQVAADFADSEYEEKYVYSYIHFRRRRVSDGFGEQEIGQGRENPGSGVAG
ncbi:hypothetical protein ACTM9N_03190 [Lachnospiraceae bacterium HCP1S3_A8]|nr:hypothetical protein [Lachnospiraceae bacterium]